jgi:hypothetical protein
MDCKFARSELALRVGLDHNPQYEQQVERHLASCPQCRTFSQNLKSSTAILQKVATHSEEVACESVWPQVRNHLSVRRETVVARESVSRSHVAGWFPVGALAAACLALIVFSSSPPLLRDEGMRDFATARMNVSGGMYTQTPWANPGLRRVDDREAFSDSREGRLSQGYWTQPQLAPNFDSALREY